MGFQNYGFTLAKRTQEKDITREKALAALLDE
jgi:hypothetical protein